MTIKLMIIFVTLAVVTLITAGAFQRRNVPEN